MENTFKSIADFKGKMAADPALQNAFQTDPVEASKAIHDSPLVEDTWIYRIVVISLGLSIVLIVIGVILLISIKDVTNDKEVPAILTAIGSGAIGALAGLLAPSPKK